MLINYDHSLDNTLSNIKGSQSDIYLFGTGAMANIAMRLLSESGITIKAFIIDDEYYTTDEYKNIPVIKFSSYNANCSDNDYVWICLDNLAARQAIASKLKTTNIIKTSFPIEAYRADYYLDYTFYAEHKAEFESTYELLADDISRNTMEHYVYACISGDIEPLNADPKPNQYFNDLTKNCDCSSFLDCGSFIGDTVIDALRFYGEDKINSVISFEPDDTNAKKIEESVAKGDIPAEKFTLMRYGTSDKYAKLRFSSNGDGSSICEDGDIVIEVNAIDEMVNRPVTFIKMDIEGSEYDAIVGASRIIKENIPTLAICVYHKREDLIEIPKLIMSIAGEDAYNFYIRHHQTNLTELVLYAIPK